MKPIYIHLTLASCLLVGAVALYVFAYLYIEDIGKRVVATEQEIRNRNAEVANIREAQNALAALAESEARIRRYFVPEGEVVAFLEEIGRTGDALGADVTVVGVTEKTIEDGRTMLDLSVQATGPFASVMRTLGTLEFAPYDITLSNLSMNAAESADAAWSASASFDVGTYTP